MTFFIATTLFSSCFFTVNHDCSNLSHVLSLGLSVQFLYLVLLEIGAGDRLYLQSQTKWGHHLLLLFFHCCVYQVEQQLRTLFRGAGMCNIPPPQHLHISFDLLHINLTQIWPSNVCNILTFTLERHPRTRYKGSHVKSRLLTKCIYSGMLRLFPV